MDSADRRAAQEDWRNKLTSKPDALALAARIVAEHLSLQSQGQLTAWFCEKNEDGH